ncbi:hypothetical protein B9Z55_013233 [Caenorhabditis nigoni]|uniref:F-box domain-containing protein n=1 Tax=Caenorhabditis nigoni TaxID=1611254 RepID=A0A2G5U0T5_9PELO|nr:hypothetical protein B9Z55_013233 [Caenorhabditis nigoni]
MPSDLENLIEKTDPFYDTNWCDMPAEIKLECIGKMKFRERLSLRCTAKAERSLVDSQKIEFDEGRFWGDDKMMSFEILSCAFTDYKKLIISDDGLFTAKKIEFLQCDIGIVDAVLRKMKTGVETIKINYGRNISHELAEILAIPHVQNVPYWHIHNYEETDSLHKMWIDKSSKIGSTFQVYVQHNDSFRDFLEHFDDRILSKNENRVRIRTNNPDRHILLERGLDPFVLLDYEPIYFRLKMISAEMKESEYDDDCQKWIRKFDREIYRPKNYYAQIGFYGYYYK